MKNTSKANIKVGDPILKDLGYKPCTFRIRNPWYSKPSRRL